MTPDFSVLADNYLDSILVEDSDFVIHDNASHDVASLNIQLPTAMLLEYLSMKGIQDWKFDGVEFVKETKLVEKLEASEKSEYSWYRQPLLDTAYWLKGEIYVSYEVLSLGCEAEFAYVFAEDFSNTGIVEIQQPESLPDVIYVSIMEIPDILT